MAETIAVTDHYERVAERLPTQFRDKPNIDALVEVWTDQIQELEDHFNEIPVNTRLHKAGGVNLDRYGELLGIKRPPDFNDDEWFGVIAGKLAARASDATVNSIRKTTEALTEMFNTNIIEIHNKLEWISNGTVRLTGDIFVYGYYNRRDRTLSGQEGNLLKAACPVTTNVAIFGQHIQYSDSERSLYIPCEIAFTNDELGVKDPSDPTVHTLVDDAGGTNSFALSANNFDKFGPNWENGVLPEEGGGNELLSVNALDPGFEDFLVSEEDDLGQRFRVNTDGIGTDHGIFLEISTST